MAAKKKTTPKKTGVQVHMAQLVPAAQLAEHPRNSNKQSRHTHKELKRSIKEEGFDENLIICPRDDGQDGYFIVSGNHRFKIGKSLGMSEFPCVIRDDWEQVQQQIQLVRRNYHRGKIDKASFTAAVNALSEDSALSLDLIQEQMGFSDPDSFAELYEEEKAREERIAEAVAGGNSGGGGGAANKVRMIDDLGLVLSTIFERFGDSAPQSFLIFPAGGKNHMYINVTPALKRILETVAQGCVQQQLDMNIVLGGLLAIGMDNSAFKTLEPEADRIVERGSEVGDDNFTLPTPKE